MTCIATQNGYAYWIGEENGERYYNVTRVEQPKPQGGYYSHEFICKVKDVENLFIR